MASSESDSHHMVLRPDKTRVFHLFQLLFRTKLDGHVSIETPIGMEIDWEKRRWAVFISVLLQKILMFIRKPMAWFGSAIEYWLNLVAKNHGFISLVFNILTGPYTCMFNFNKSLYSCLQMEFLGYYNCWNGKKSYISRKAI
ncbi:hypothetical protein BHE74_00049528 [Ensete ventricosum]|nr:hypothetical protein BHE74_00049528 [Ensete ventricosum]RZR98310.1 hypothetical protein BHM03_00027620 [Ensete ventricosum]